MGEVRHIGYEDPESFTMKISAKTVLDGVNLGDSIGVNLGDSIGVNETCLTVTEFDTQLSEFTVGLALETLRKTSEHRSLVNLEGAFVQGHLDRTRVILGLDPEGDSLWVKVKMTKELIKYMVDVFDDE
nr:riboflavin synthase [Ipomoea trifida]